MCARVCVNVCVSVCACVACKCVRVFCACVYVVCVCAWTNKENYLLLLSLFCFLHFIFLFTNCSSVCANHTK